MDALLCQVHSSHGSSAPNKHAGLMLTVLKAYTEVEDSDWRVDDEAFREKMAATGCKMWGGMDVQLYQEVCAGKLRRKAPGGRSEPVGASGRRGLKQSGGERRAGECWQFRSAGSGMTAGSSMTGDRTMVPPTKCKPCMGRGYPAPGTNQY